jgi:hypothetical protein
MDRKGLFVVLDGITRHNRLAAVLKDFRALGYRIIGITSGASKQPYTGGIELDAIVRTEPGEWEFPSFAWSIARRFSLNVRRSVLCSADLTHERWARNAGILRFETPEALGI